MSRFMYHFGLAVAAFSGALLIGNAMSYPTARVGGMLLWLSLLLASALFGVALFAALRKNPDTTGGQYFDLLQWPIAAFVLLLAGGILGFQAG